MKLVIDIPEEVREHIFDLANDGNEIPLGINTHMVKAIVNGTPLDKLKDKIGLEMLEYSSSVGYYRLITKVLQTIDKYTDERSE